MEKLLTKHGVSVTVAEEELISKPIVRRVTKGKVRGEDLYFALVQIHSGRY